MNRLFVLGDSWAFNYFSKNNDDRTDQIIHLNNSDVASFVKEFNYYGHWTDYLKDWFDVYNFSEHGCCNEDIIHQFGFIPNYIDGDRIVIIFTNPSRYQWIINNQKKALTIGSPWQNMMTQSEKEVVNNQLILRDNLWFNTFQRNNEKLFISKIPMIFNLYNPILLTWDYGMSESIDCVELLNYNSEYKSIETESGGKYKDGHMGINGNFEIFKFVANKLNITKMDLEYKTIVKSII